MSAPGPQHGHHLLLPPQGRLLHLDVLFCNTQTELKVSATSTEIWALLQSDKCDKSMKLTPRAFIMKVKEELGASNFEALDPDNPSFIIVRHPLDRLASAFNDRILNKDTDQVRLHIAHIIQDQCMSSCTKIIDNIYISPGQTTPDQDTALPSNKRAAASNILPISELRRR